MTNQNLFNALQDFCGFTALESDIAEIIRAVERDRTITFPPQADIDYAARHPSMNMEAGFLEGADWMRRQVEQLNQPTP